jgi:hypothetical protein
MVRLTTRTSPRIFRSREILHEPIHRQFNIHFRQCRQCHRWVQGRHPLQTSDTLSAAAQQGPDALAGIVELNRHGGLSHGKVRRCLEPVIDLCAAGHTC